MSSFGSQFFSTKFCDGANPRCSDEPRKFRNDTVSQFILNPNIVQIAGPRREVRTETADRKIVQLFIFFLVTYLQQISEEL